MPSITDPATELTDLCKLIMEPSDQIGEQYLSQRFGVEPWSHEFYQIIFCIIERINDLKIVIQSIDDANDVAAEAIAHLENLRIAFQADSMRKKWRDVGANHANFTNIQAIKMLSPTIRQHVKYAKLSAEEIAEVNDLVQTLIKWLNDFQMNDHDFIRQSLISGLQQFHFRLERLGWLGWGYTIESLRDVIGAYLALERSYSLDPNPQSEAILKKAGSVIKAIYSKIGVAKDAVERGDFLLTAYGAVTLAGQAVHRVAGLLPSP